MRKIITILLFIITAAFAQSNFKIIPPEEAFTLNFEEKNGFLLINIEMREGIYLLADKFVLEAKSPKKVALTSLISTPEPEIYKEQRVFWNSYESAISMELLRSLGLSGKIELSVTYQGCAGGGVICYPPLVKTHKLIVPKSTSSEQSLIAEMLQNQNFFVVIISFFGFGLLLSLTPCTFPMVPILSSIIAKQSKESMNAKRGFWLSVIYVFFMSLAYAIAGVFAGLFGANIQSALQNPIAIGIFSAIFVALSMPMFGSYKFQLPISWQTKFSKSFGNKSGVSGVAFMGFVSSLIVGPCVAAPLAGALMYIGQSGNALLGGGALFIMSVGMGVPLLIVGASAGKFLPKPGFWMDMVQRIFGFIMLGVAIWMLSRVLPPFATLLLWAVLIAAFAIYLFRFAHLKIVKILCVGLGIYALALFVGAVNGGGSLYPLENFKSEESKKLPLDFTQVKNTRELDNAVKTSAKPIMLEFTASWCAICTEFEDKTLSKPSVQKALESFTLLRVDVTKNSNDDKELMRRFSLYGPPAIIFFKDGLELRDLQIVGFKNEQEFLEYLGQI